MATSSITKTFIIKDEAALKRFEREMEKPSPPSIAISSKLEEGKLLLKQYFEPPIPLTW
ncbi:hypothetical protein FACS1894187_21870 [Synergistales bacterium]|nr:hypothetical protein FACS1894187_21870 [Synergistales bacterium]